MKLNFAQTSALAATLTLLITGQAGAAIRPADAQTALEMEAVTAGHYAAQSDGVTLSQAVESVRRRGDVERVIDAKTEVRNGREMHYVRVMTKDGKVKTHTIRGKRIANNRS